MLARFRFRKPPKQKYRNKRGGGYDSRIEARVGALLEGLRAASEARYRVVDVQRQVSFVLIPKQYDDDGKLAEREACYIADFVVRFADGRREVIDVKSPVTRRLPAYVLKRKLLLFRYRLPVREIQTQADLWALAARTRGT